MKSPLAAAKAVGLILLGTGLPSFVAAGDFYKWTDDEGQVHYSNRSGSSPQPPKSGSGAGGGDSESGLEAEKGSGAFQQKVDAAINTLELKLARKQREWNRAQEALQATQAELSTQTEAAQKKGPLLDASDLTPLHAREAAQAAEVSRLDAELSAIRADIAKIRAMKAVDKSSSSP